MGFHWNSDKKINKRAKTSIRRVIMKLGRNPPGIFMMPNFTGDFYIPGCLVAEYLVQAELPQYLTAGRGPHVWKCQEIPFLILRFLSAIRIFESRN